MSAPARGGAWRQRRKDGGLRVTGQVDLALRDDFWPNPLPGGVV